MSPEIRRAALRAAAKAAIVVSLGCGGSRAEPAPAPEPAPPSSSGGSSTDEGASCAEHLGALATAERDELPEGDPLRERHDVYGAFADRAARESERTQACCTEELLSRGEGSAHRWECCSALGDVPEGADPTACTPWGPPCPPDMIA